MRDVFAICLGGLGASQLGDILAAVKAIPGVFAWSPLGGDQYDTDILQAVSVYPSQEIVLIGHSLACATVISAAKALADSGRKVAYLCIIEPVYRDKDLPPVDSYDWLQSDALIDFPRANMEGATVTIIKGTDHNSICHNALTISTVVEKITRIGA